MRNLISLAAAALVSTALFAAVACTVQPEADNEGAGRGQSGASSATPRRETPDAGRPKTEESSLDRAGVTGTRVSGSPHSRADALHTKAAPLTPTVPAGRIDREQYAHFDDNPVKLARQEPVSTFSVDVDTGAYANVRRFLESGRLPPQDAVRVEEMINYFDYEYAGPDTREMPFRVHTDLARAPWNHNRLLLRVGLKGWAPEIDDLPPANLVFLVDVSGSMSSPDKLGLVKRSLEMLTRELRPVDRVAIVTYAGRSGVALESTAGSEKGRILAGINRLSAGGSTAGASGIRLAYQQAAAGIREGGINRVILATDGDFNVGVTDFEQLLDMVERRRKSGISLTTLGFGTGNYNEKLMEQLADRGDGNYAYIDGINEARKVLVEQRAATLHTIARDVKIQIEFNPARVAEYRLIGYENRALAREDFNNDAVDAGEIGAGHTVTALYEITPAGSDARRLDPLRYSGKGASDHGGSDELAFLRLRYKQPGEQDSRLMERAITGQAEEKEAGGELAFAAAVAAFGQRLRGGKYLDGYEYDDILSLARRGRGDDPDGYRGEFLQLVGLAATLDKG